MRLDPAGGVLDPALWRNAKGSEAEGLEECSIRRLGGVLDPALWRSAKGIEGGCAECTPWRS